MILIAMGMALMAGFWWWLAHLGPRKIESEAATASPTSVATASRNASVRDEVEKLVNTFEAGGEDADIALLVAAVAEQEKLVAQGGGAGQAEQRRLQELEQKLAGARGLRSNERIAEWEVEAQAHHDAGRAREATVAWGAALELQQAVNRSAAPTAVKDFVREARMERLLQEQEATPLAEEVSIALRKAREAAAAENWADALAAYATARELQVRLNGEYGRTRFADLAVIDQIEREIQSLDAAGSAASVDEAEAAGDAAMAAAAFSQAAAAFEDARQLQVRINREFSRSRFLSSPRVEQLEVKRQTAESMPLLETLRADSEAIAFLLRRRETEKAGERIADAARRVTVLFEQLSKSDQLDPALRLRLSYLDTQRERLREIQDVVFERLRPLPGAAELRMLRTEFPQSLYLQIMKVNPSRHAGRAFPVDSVSWFDAVECCERLGWILGLPVRLPTKDEFRVAVGADALGEVTSETTKAAAGGDVSQAMAAGEANAAGFFDLLGNLAEWLHAPASEQGAETAPVAGGSYLDDPATPGPERPREVPRSERARHIGFRVVVEPGA